MAGRKGKAFRLYRGDGATSEVFSVVGGAREESLTGSNPTAEITDKDDEWVTLLADATNRSLRFQISGRFKTGDTNIAALRTSWLNSTIDNYRAEVITTPGTGFSFAAQVTEWSESGSDGDVQTFSGTLQSSGAVTYGAF